MANAEDHAGVRLRRLREERGVLRKDLAAILQISPQQLARVEAGLEELDLLDWRILAWVLDVPVCYFILREDRTLAEEESPLKPGGAPSAR